MRGRPSATPGSRAEQYRDGATPVANDVCPLVLPHRASLASGHADLPSDRSLPGSAAANQALFVGTA